MKRRAQPKVRPSASLRPKLIAPVTSNPSLKLSDLALFIRSFLLAIGPNALLSLLFLDFQIPVSTAMHDAPVVSTKKKRKEEQHLLCLLDLR